MAAAAQDRHKWPVAGNPHLNDPLIFLSSWMLVSYRAMTSRFDSDAIVLVLDGATRRRLQMFADGTGMTVNQAGAALLSSLLDEDEFWIAAAEPQQPLN